ncbi:TniQ family protein [Opitutus terrae]|uniref:TniQ domain-containing protein n=1 Tax=Opitutus terrae (strain DSM 11246 / JCM 15787 / PB90-1) TaxID=452637 RepID=B1ZMH9_OPITP|nr:TniQ family protein [Opitutus terrae]ACB74324.1 hypothetical protein Oter_1036 [Opitutus terrae PB90-1]
MKSSCTEILRVTPCDPDGAQRESLASLLVRTARENDVSPAQLLEWKFATGTGLQMLKFSTRALGRSVGQSINGCSEVARMLVNRTEQLTRLDGLRRSTTLAFAPFTTFNGLLRQQLAWSVQSLRSQETKYYPLLWALEPVRVCPETRKPLGSLCPTCRQSLVLLSGGSHIGRCYRCGSSLFETNIGAVPADPIVGSIRSIDYEVWVARELGNFIRFQTVESLSEDFSYHRALEHWLDLFELRSNRDAAKALGASPLALFRWRSNKAIPRLRMTLNLCWVFGISLVDFLLLRRPSGHDGRLRQSIDAGMRHAAVSTRRRIDKARLGSELSTILRENRYSMMSFSEICSRKLRRRDVVIRQNFPEEARLVARRYLENRKLMADIKRDQFCAALETVARFLHARGIVPNYKTLSPYLDRPSKLRCAWAIAALRRVREELGYEDPSEQLMLLI